MSIFKCKMCGGTLEINNNESVATCEYCGTQQTLPRLDDEKKANLYDRANHFRRNNDYDKAMGIYETILNEDKTDAEAYWSLVLCRYGIEYVEDPASHKRIPTINRAQFTSIFDDDNYKSALQYADGYQKTVYEEEAKAINEIQKGILEISQKEEPFDVFICYKETDANGRRTQDSVLANDLYHQLTQEGFKVFFARITLEDKLGSAYEPYIFAALNSAKVMVVLGTKPEYFNAVWVKNEWSRYLSLIKSGAKKMLIPAYKDMDPYDLPEEFSHLQAQDMSKLGFMQDLIRGIKKIAQTDEPKTTVVKETVVTGGNTNTAPLLKRAFMFLEDGDWQSADEYCEKVLDIEPECARAYLGKLMAELEVRKQELLGNQAEEFTDSINYQKACRFADDELKSALDDYSKNVIYLKAQRTMTVAKEESNFKTAASIFARVKGYKDADSKKSECLEKAEACRKDVIYNNALKSMEKDTVDNYNSAISEFETIKGWKDSDEKIAQCKRRIEEIKAKQEAERLERERRIEEAKIEAEKRKKLIKKIVAIATPIAAVLVAFVIVLTTVIMPQSNYKKALCEVDTGNYSNAYMLFEKYPDYKDTQEQIKIAKAKEAFSLLEAEKYDEAYKILKGIGNNEEIAKNKYERAVAFIDSGEYEAAIALLKGLNYKDSDEKLDSIIPQYYKNFFQKNENTFMESVSAGEYHTVGLKADGTVVAVGNNEHYQCDVEDWKDIVAVSAGDFHTVGLKADGTVVAVGSNYFNQCDVEDWADIVAVSAGDYHTVGLKADGTVVAVGDNECNQCDVEVWTDIVAISAGDEHTVGLKSDATVVAVGSNAYNQCDVEDWTDIVAVSAGDYHTVGLKADGTVVAVGNNEHYQCDVEDWKDIVAVSAGDFHTVGLKSDGKVVAVGWNFYDFYSVFSWTDIVAVSAGYNNTVGLKSDGTVVAVGNNEGHHCDVEDWNNIKTPKR